MAILIVRGTRLEPPPVKLPLNRPFLFVLGMLYLIFLHVPSGLNIRVGLTPIFNMMTWFWVSMAISVGLFQVIRAGKIRYSKLTLGLLVCCLLLTLPLFYDRASVSLAMPRVIALWGGFFLFAVLQQFRFSNKHKHRLIWLIVLSVLVECGVAYYQLCVEPSRVPLGVFPTVNTFATYIATGLLASGYLLSRHLKKYQAQFSIASLLYIMPLLCMPLLVLLRSVTGWGVTLIGMVMIFPYLYRFASRKRLWGWSVSMMLGLLLGFILIQALYTTPFNAQSINRLSPLSDSLSQTIDMFIEKPFTGYGYGHFEEEYVLYSARQHQLNPNYPSPLAGLSHPHNEVLYWGIEGGLLPIFAITLAALFVLGRIYGAKPKTRLATLSLLFPIAMVSQVDEVFSLSAIHWITLIILLFWVDQRVAKYRSVSVHRVTMRGLNGIGIILPLLALLYCGAFLRAQSLLKQYKQGQAISRQAQMYLPLVWQDQLIQAQLIDLLKQKNTEQHRQQLSAYVPWLLELIQRQPRPAYYQLLMALYQHIGDLNRAEQSRIEAEFLFPQYPFTLSDNTEFADPG
ncbi:Wzy polymerase domain-containing protein [Vibrio rhizosphaerae]|uniref:Wzy polymerase domain-containing protein n=1 Tax=Vibrio rhizosphaerae TaxID=398736 RepID=A0ABU4INT7_9VIBR|nr:Wzy polymerase domain-containing protein [Vibrio rhizosphaerae]MDW6091065.1 Wzy polymerase domain-containing protein [Vibrio rhizosphaerae]